MRFAVSVFLLCVLSVQGFSQSDSLNEFGGGVSLDFSNAPKMKGTNTSSVDFLNESIDRGNVAGIQEAVDSGAVRFLVEMQGLGSNGKKASVMLLNFRHAIARFLGSREPKKETLNKIFDVFKAEFDKQGPNTWRMALASQPDDQFHNAIIYARIEHANILKAKELRSDIEELEAAVFEKELQTRDHLTQLTDAYRLLLAVRKTAMEPVAAAPQPRVKREQYGISIDLRGLGGSGTVHIPAAEIDAAVQGSSTVRSKLPQQP